MKLTSRIQWAIVVGGMVAVTTLTAAASRRADVALVAIGDTAPAFSELEILNFSVGEFRYANLARGPLMLVIWATWCQACVEGMPALQRVHERLGPRGLRIVAVTIDARFARSEVWRIIRDARIDFDVIHDPEAQVARAYGVVPIPQVFFINAGGIIRERWVGKHDLMDPTMLSRISALLPAEAGRGRTLSRP